MAQNNEIKIVVNVEGLPAVYEYIEQLHAEINYLRAVVQMLDPEMIPNPN